MSEISAAMRVLAFDPGYGRTGWGVVDGASANRLEAVAWGLIETDPSLEIPFRLFQIYEEARCLIEKYSPTALAMEKLLWKASTTTAPGVFQAQGAVLSAAGKAGLSCLELAPTAIKKAVAGSGRASKIEVERMLCRILDLDVSFVQDDTADALALAIAAIQTMRFQKVLESQKGSSNKRAQEDRRG